MEILKTLVILHNNFNFQSPGINWTFQCEWLYRYRDKFSYSQLYKNLLRNLYNQVLFFSITMKNYQLLSFSREKTTTFLCRFTRQMQLSDRNVFIAAEVIGCVILPKVLRWGVIISLWPQLFHQEQKIQIKAMKSMIFKHKDDF